MIRSLFIFIVITTLFSCKGKQSSTVPLSTSTTDIVEKNENFFPVTSYIQGQVIDIKGGGVNPMKYVTTKKITDSSWIKMEDLDKEIAPFLTPVIDTSNMLKLFTEQKFLDQTLNNITFTYDPVAPLPDTFSLQHWDVYINPQNNQVSRVYLVKKLDANRILQLTWQNNRSALMVYIGKDKNGQSVVDKEILIKWEF